MSMLPQNAEPMQAMTGEVARAVSKELHQTAQPLTVLQGLLELSLLNAATIEEYRSSVERAINELQRVVAGFDHVRELIHSTQMQPATLPSRKRTAHHV